MLRILNRILPTGKVFIKNSDLPICLHCVHFIRPTELQKANRDDYERYGRCKKFGKMNLITGEIEYNLARHCRLDDETCGYIGTGYKETPVEIGKKAD
jgi:hypothetical protein